MEAHMKVHFSDVREFQEELALDKTRIYRSIVRATKMFQPTKLSSTIRQVHVIASACVRSALVELRVYCGQDWGPDFPQSKETLEKADQIITQLEGFTQSHGLELRAGVFSPNGEAWQ
jgi:hypothetical protein